MARDEAGGTISRGETLRVLYIEDNQANLVLMQSVFGLRGGTTLLSAGSAREGLEAVRRDRPDLVLLDLHLPDGDGNEVLRQLKADESTRSIPVIAVTADARDEQASETLGAGADAFVTKPIDVQALLRLVDQTLGRGAA